MTIINQKSISGITSITTAAAGDNLLTVHTNNGTERLRIDSSGNTRITAGIVTTLTVTGNGTVGGTLSVTGDVDIADKIVHTGDTNTAIRFPAADTITAETGGTERLRINSTGQTIVGDSVVQLSTNSERPFQVHSVNGPKIAIGRNDTSISDGNTIGGLEFYGNDANGTFVNTASIIVNADGTHGDNDKPTRMQFYTTADGGSSATERLRIDSSGKIIIPIGTTTRIGVADRTSGTGAGGSLLVTAGAARGSGQTTGDLILASGRGNNSASAGTIRFGYNDGSDGTNLDQEWLRITSGGVVNIGANASSNPFTYLRFGASQYGAADIRPIDEGSHKVGLAFYVDGTQDTTINPTEKMRIRSDGHVKLQQGLTALSGGGVIVCAAKSSSGTANQSNYKVDFVVPMADLGPKQEYEDIQSQFSSGQTGKDWAHNRGGSGILIATVQNDYYWGFRTKIYHITTYGNNSNNVTQLNLLHNYSAAGHGSNSASVDLTVQSHDGKTPTLRGTFSGDYWNSNILTVTYIGSAVASTGSIRQLTTFDSKLTGQDPTWK